MEGRDRKQIIRRKERTRKQQTKKREREKSKFSNRLKLKKKRRKKREEEEKKKTSKTIFIFLFTCCWKLDRLLLLYFDHLPLLHHQLSTIPFCLVSQLSSYHTTAGHHARTSNPLSFVRPSDIGVANASPAAIGCNRSHLII